MMCRAITARDTMRELMVLIMTIFSADRQSIQLLIILELLFIIPLWHITKLTIYLSQCTQHQCITQPCLLYTSPSPRDRQKSRMPSSA